jgi:hypothetical protein
LDERRLGCVTLAKRQLETLRVDVAELESRQIAAVRERLAAAALLAPDQPAAAGAVYQAIIDLYGNDSWAAELVAEARTQTEKLNAAHE